MKHGHTYLQICHYGGIKWIFWEDSLLGGAPSQTNWTFLETKVSRRLLYGIIKKENNGLLYKECTANNNDKAVIVLQQDLQIK